ncbi:peroxisome assembly factor 2 [Ischnura elegans]|uniref:peroxisome assembly factor 2 n=1 Tax=Ischnura elegans TaxID=197161 RepID=UPI001ED86AA6|nr:peroxisome assembly factor 2 [Ischnura elegans]
MLCLATKCDYKSMLKFLCWLAFINRPKFYFVVFCYLCLTMSDRGLFLISVSNEVMRRILFEAGFEENTDIDNYVIVSNKHLLEPFNTGKIPCWVQLYSYHNNGKESERIRLALAVGLPGTNSTVMIASDVLCYNIKRSLLPRGAVRFNGRPRMKFRIVKDSPKFAENLELGLIKEKLGSSRSSPSVEASVSSFYKAPRYVHAGDIVSITGPDGQRAHYAVVRLQGTEISPGFLVQTDKTKIEKGPEVKFYVPAYPVSQRILRNSTQVTAANFKEFLIPKCPPWLSDHAASLSRCLLPFLPPPNDLDIIKPAASHHLLPVILLSGPQGTGKRAVIAAACGGAMGTWEVGSLHLCTHDCSELRGTGPGSIEKTLASLLASLSSASLCLLAIHNIEWLALGRDGPDEGRGIESWISWLADLKRQCPGVVGVVATTRQRRSDLPAALARTFIEEISLHEGPNVAGREGMIQWLLDVLGSSHHQELPKALAQHTAGFMFGDLQALISGALRKKYMEVKNCGSELVEDFFLEESDFEEALVKMQAAYSDAIGAPKIPSVKWEDVGGLSEIREEILTTIELPLKHPKLLHAGLKRTGILLYGPPGTGKTLLAKAVATECNFNFISVKGPELLNMFIGQSEANVREVFQRARSASPCIIFFDELDSLAPNRGRAGDSGGVMDRVVSQLLAEMDGHYKSTNVFVMAATNRPDLVDPALLRPGRFDKILYVGPYEDKKSQLSVLSALTRKFQFADDISLESIVALFPDLMSGADALSVCTGAVMRALQRLVAELAEGNESDSEGRLAVRMEDFQQSIRELRPSVAAEDIIQFQRLRLQYEK